MIPMTKIQFKEKDKRANITARIADKMTMTPPIEHRFVMVRNVASRIKTPQPSRLICGRSAVGTLPDSSR
jgi:hypothetical protein